MQKHDEDPDDSYDYYVTKPYSMIEGDPNGIDDVTEMKPLMMTERESNDDSNESCADSYQLTSAAKKRGCFPKNATNKLKHWLFQNLTVKDCYYRN